MIHKSLSIHFLLTCALSAFSLIVGAQVDQKTIDGKTYYVYPHQLPVQGMQDYYLSFADKKEVIKRDDRNEKIVSVTEEPLSELEKKSALKFPKSYKKYLKDFEQILEFYPSFLITTDNGLNVDPTPALVSLPDGEYVLFYRDVPYISKRVLRYKNDIPAAFFTVKNNVIQGKSTWFTVDGKVVKTGEYQNSEKSGSWKLYEYSQRVDQEYKYDPKESIENRLKKIQFDTITYTTHFFDGLKNGPFTVYNKGELMTSGHFTMDKESGTWEMYQFKTHVTTDKKGNLVVTQSKEKILVDRYTLRSDKKRGKSPIMRHSVVPYEFTNYISNDSLILQNTYSTGNPYGQDYAMEFPDFSNFLTVLETDTNPLELPEESLTSYEGEEMYASEYFYPEMELESETTYNPNEYYEYVNGKRYTLNNLIDSMGYLYKYEGIVEHYYENGQLQYKFEIKDGQLVEEAPIYWDNGTIANEVVFLADSNQYVQRFYDYNGKKYFEMWYDSKGNVLEGSGMNPVHSVAINGKKYDPNYSAPTYLFTNDNALKKGDLPDRILLIEELFKADSSVAKQVWFYPQTRTVNAFQRNILGDTVGEEEAVFSEDYLNVNAVSNRKFKNMELRIIRNGLLDDYWKYTMHDTVAIEKMALNWENKYSREEDRVLYVNGKIFTGNFKLTDRKSSFSAKATNELIQLSLPGTAADNKLYKSALKSYLKSKKRSDILIGYVSNFGGSTFLSHSITSLFPDLYGVFLGLYGHPGYGLDGQNETYEEMDYRAGARVADESLYTSVEGKYLNGKPEGVWTYKDQFGKIRSVVGYKNGDPHGDNLDYSVAYPKPKKSKGAEELYNYEDPLSKYEEFPEKKTYYVDSKCTYKNGILEGPHTTMGWKGDTLTYVNYVEGAKEGVEFKRNKLFYSQAYYRNGFVDGNVKTWFTHPEKDSVLIFNLGFKNGALQGESVAYHSNGKLAKKGFFLTGQPIDDYEAYDTLGFRYQYVKFQYNQPVEEKIWEENELSVRYEFDWRDSIPFNFADITESSSIDQLIYQAGYSDYGLYEPYYGRPSLVNKTGIDYYITKYYPNDTVARVGGISKGIKTGCWKYFNYYGKKLMEVEYFDTVITVNDSIKFKSKGILYYLDQNDNPLSKSWIIEKFEKYDCSHTDHNEERMLYCFWEKDTAQHRRNGYVKNYYDNGSIQNEGYVKDGLPTGVWKLYDVNGNLNQVGEYVQGKRNGRWLKGDLGSVKNMSEICLNPNLENLDAILSYQEKLLDVSVITYQIGKELKRKYYGINMNNEEAPEGYFGDEMNYGEY